MNRSAEHSGLQDLRRIPSLVSYHFPHISAPEIPSLQLAISLKATSSGRTSLTWKVASRDCPACCNSSLCFALAYKHYCTACGTFPPYCAGRLHLQKAGSTRAWTLSLPSQPYLQCLKQCPTHSTCSIFFNFEKMLSKLPCTVET